ncbi:EAL domain-containing protein [Vibrio natriegens]|uniref:EAL domain-containing protein n=1 Tax=Vibrio natriegens TaxID=691 RepID=UPI00228370A9|nr:EAL domain-containing protein [Vibrio natriegens]MCY9879055.1 EAL domain-containing protein [Vibrio natriegens]
MINSEKFKFEFADDGGVRCLIIVEDNMLFADFSFLLQPIYHPLSKDIYACELLTRVTRTSGESIESNDFFRYLNDDLLKSILITQLAWINEIFNTNESEIIFSLNIPFSCVEDNDFIDTLLSFENNNKVALEIDFFSSDLDLKKLKNSFGKLRRNGYLLHFDNFNVNNGINMNLLDLFDWDLVKIDRELLINNLLDDELELLIKAISNYCSNIVLQGVETSYQYDSFKNKDLFMQGYYFSPPINHFDVLEVVKFRGL